MGILGALSALLLLLAPLLQTAAFKPGDAYDHVRNAYVPALSRWMEVGFFTVYTDSWTSVEATYRNFSDPVVFLSLPQLSAALSLSLRVNNTRLQALPDGLSRYSFEARSYGVSDEYCNTSLYNEWPTDLILQSVPIGWLVVERGMFNVSHRAFIVQTDSITRSTALSGDTVNVFKSSAPNDVCNYGENCKFNDVTKLVTIAQLQTTRYARFLLLRSAGTTKRTVTYILLPHDSVNPQNFVIPYPGEAYAWILFENDLSVSCLENLVIETREYTVRDVYKRIVFQNSFTAPPVLFGMVNSLFGGDSLGLRSFNVSTNTADFVTQEDRCSDKETAHTNEEKAAILLIGTAAVGSVRCGATFSFMTPTVVPSARPSLHPSAPPSAYPTTTAAPSLSPSAAPSAAPTAAPTLLPTPLPTAQPSVQPSVEPTLHPSAAPTGQPTSGIFITKSSISSDGFTITVDFSAATNRAPMERESFPCDEIVYFTLAHVSICSWTSSTRLSARLYSNTAVPYDGSVSASTLGAVNVLPLSLKAACDIDTGACAAAPYAGAAHQVPIALPATPLAPVVVLSASSSYICCAGITFDPKPSTGKAGVQWRKVEWSVSGTGNADMANALLNANFSDATDSLIRLPLDIIASAGNFTTTLSLTNFFGITRTSSVSSFADDSLLRNSVSIVGSQDAHVHRNRMLNLFTRTTTPKCLGVGAPQLKYVWTVTSPDSETPYQLESTSSDPRRFRLPAYSLNSSTAYSVEVTAVVDDERVVSASYVVNVTVDPLYGTKAKIRGGALRTVSGAAPWALDASQSYHLDQPGAALRFRWACADVTSAASVPCGLDLQNTSQLSIPALDLSSDRTYEFTVTVSSDVDSGSSAASVTVEIAQGDVPLIVMGDVADKVNPVSYLLLSCTIDTPFPVLATWSSAEANATALAAAASTPLAHSFAAGSHLFTLKLLPGLLSEGSFYTFSVSTAAGATSRMLATAGALSRAEVVVEVNVPPYRGALRVAPSVGVALNTTFTLETDSWIAAAENYPLLYRMSYYTADPAARLALLAKGAVSNIDAVFGEGDPNAGYAVTCVAAAVDVFGSAGEVSREIIVYPNPATISSLLAAAAEGIAAAGNATDFDLMDQLTSGFAMHLAVPDCTAAPDCAALQREPCSAFPNTCGTCLAGSVGLAVPSNNACVPPKDGNASQIRSGACSVAADCLSYQCQAGQCVSTVPAECPGGCSGRGQCQAVDSNRDELASCSLFDPFCSVECRCDAGFHGKYCGYTDSEFEDVQVWQELLCTEYHRLSELTDVLEDSAVSRASIMALLLADVTLLSPAAFDSCAAVVIGTITGDPEVCGESTPYYYWLGVLSAALATQGDANPAVLEAILAAVVLLASGAQQHLATGESYVTSTAHIRAISRLSFPLGEGDAAEFFDVPRTAQETASGVTFGTIDIGEVSPEGSSEVGHVVILYLNIPAGVFGNATRIELETVYYASDTSAARRRLAGEGGGLVRNVTVVLPNTRPFDGDTIDVTDEAVVDCFINLVGGVETSYLEGVDCGSESFEVECLGNSTYSIIVDCLSKYLLPACSVWGDSGVLQSDNCSVVQYSRWSTTCLCSESVSVRPLSKAVGDTVTAGQNSIKRNYGVTAELVGESFASRFGSVTSLSLDSLEKNIVIFGIMLSLVLLLVVGGALILYSDILFIEYAAIREKYVDSNFMRARSFKALVSDALPVQFSPLPWFLRYKALLCEEHEWLALFFADRSDYSQHNNFVLLLWVHAFGKLINFFFVGTVLAILYFADDNTCENYSSRSACLEPVSIDLQNSLCEWDTHTSACSFVEVRASFGSAVAVAIAINILVSPVDALLRFLLLMARQLLIRKEDKILSSLEGRRARSAESYAGGQLSCIQTTRSKFMCAARLGHMREHIDDCVTAFGEVDNFLSLHRGKRAAAEKAEGEGEGEVSLHELDTPNMYFKPQESVLAHQNNNREVVKWRFLVQESMYDTPAHLIQRAVWERDLLRSDVDRSSHVYWLMYNVRAARQHASSALVTLNALPDDDCRDEFLLRLFFVESMVGYRRQVAALFFLDRNKFGFKSGICASKGFQWFCALSIPAYLIFFCFYIFIFGISIGPSATNLWLVSICFAYLQNVVLIEPVLIYVYGVAIAGLIYRDVAALAARIKLHGKEILTRHHGTTFAPSVYYVHHINAACRAARQFPHLAVSRLLISFNDWDLPVSFMPEYHQTGKLAALLRTLLFLQALCALAFLYLLPTAFQETIIEIVFSLAVGFFFVVFYVSSDSGAESLGIAFGVLVFVFFILFAISYIFLRKKKQPKNYRFDADEHEAAKRKNGAEKRSPRGGGGSAGGQGGLLATEGPQSSYPDDYPEQPERLSSRVTFTDGDVSEVHIISEFMDNEYDVDDSPGGSLGGSPEESPDSNSKLLFQLSQSEAEAMRTRSALGLGMPTADFEATRVQSLHMLMKDGDASFDDDPDIDTDGVF
jgi:hypothetical protein